jgi:hypothetical protein
MIAYDGILRPTNSIALIFLAWGAKGKMRTAILFYCLAKDVPRGGHFSFEKVKPRYRWGLEILIFISWNLSLIKSQLTESFGNILRPNTAHFLTHCLN